MTGDDISVKLTLILDQRGKSYELLADDLREELWRALAGEVLPMSGRFTMLLQSECERAWERAKSKSH